MSQRVIWQKIGQLFPYINENIECSFCSIQASGVNYQDDEDTLVMWKSKIMHENCVYRYEVSNSG